MSTETERLLSLAAFRGALRPVLIAGSRSYLQKAQAAAEPFKADLQGRAVALVLLPLDVSDPAAKLRALKQQLKCAPALRLSLRRFRPARCLYCSCTS